ncbi:MAG: hypothetical protein ACOCUS_01750 [Polyangiales bacterium]
MASKRRGKGKGKGKGVPPAGASIGSKAVSAVALDGLAQAKEPRKKKPPKRRARRERAAEPAKRKPAAKPAVQARPVARSGGGRERDDRADRRRAKRLVADVRERKRRIASDFYAMGEALRELKRPEMYGALRYPSFRQLLSDQQLVSRSTAFKLIAVTETYPKDQALALGLEKAYGLIRWSNAADTDESPSELAAGDALIGDRAIHDITVRDLRERVRRIDPGSDTDGRSRARRHAERVARAMQREMRAQGLDTAKARARRVGGQWLVAVEAPVADAEAWLGEDA